MISKMRNYTLDFLSEIVAGVISGIISGLAVVILAGRLEKIWTQLRKHRKAVIYYGFLYAICVLSQFTMEFDFPGYYSVQGPPLVSNFGAPAILMFSGFLFLSTR